MEGNSDNVLLMRLGSCEVCNAKNAKYTCPRCEVKTCSINCVRIHKVELTCNGTRDKTVYKPLKKFSNLDLLSDYRLLEDIKKSVTKYNKDINKRWTRYNTALPIQLYKLRCTAFTRGVRLLFLPQNFSKHKSNTTYYDWKTKNLYWRIQWVFLGTNSEVKFVDERVLDTEKLGKIVGKYLSPTKLNTELEFYYSAGYKGIDLLLKAEKTTDKFYELDMDLSLRENLKKKTIIEFPTIYAILKHTRDEFDIIDSDADNEPERKNEQPNGGIEVIDVD